MSFVEHWMKAQRLSRAVFLVVALGGLLLWMLWNPAPTMLTRSTQTGQVVAVSQGKVTMTLIALEDGKRVRSMDLQPLPKPGDKLPMIVETYADGSVYAVVDVMAWKMGQTN